MSKSKHESAVLKEFLNALDKNKYSSCSIKSRKPPEPDLLISFSGNEEYFELARILDKSLIPLRLLALKIAPKLVKVDVTKFGLPERDIVKAKLCKNYETNSKSLSLLLYYDKGIYFNGIPPIDPTVFYNDIVKPLLISDIKFKKVFIFDRNTQNILWNN